MSLSRLDNLQTGPAYDYTYGESGINMSNVIFCEYLDYKADKDSCSPLPDKGVRITVR